ncbi:MAG: HAD family hydrolase [Syntrophales bacterium]|jgi:phosphoglycolate phosphatase|nr:HAD family hydrolase [Syntrophales bacterium]MCK9390500.1 HAD family hydrolase [Syntrophales bacterium]
MAKKLFLFDFDGVLVDSLDVYHRAVAWCLEKIGTPIIKTQDEYVALFEDNFYEAMAKKGVDLDAFSGALIEYASNVDYYHDVRLFTAVLPVLTELCSDNILAIISSNSSRAIRKILARFQYNGCFQDILGSEFHLSKKIKIDHAVATYQMNRDDTYYVGDTSGDIREGKAAGVRTIAVTWGWHSREILVAAQPDFLIDDPEELKNIPD